MGIGHFMRCLTLADALCERGARVRFICRAHPGHLIDLLQQRGTAVCVLPAPEQQRAPKGAEDYADWLGVAQEEDAEQTIRALFDEQPDWLIVDHYGLDASWERMLRPHVAKLLVIDDLANRPHDCDVLLDQNYSHDASERYRTRIPRECIQVTGPRYALLRPEYSQCRRTLRKRDGRVGRVLVFFGGADPYNMTATTLHALREPEFSHLAVDVVIGSSNPHRAALEQMVAARPRTNAHGPRTHLADLMAQADVSVGAGGTTTWERMCLGLPSLLVSIAENQEPICEALAAAGLVRYLGRHSEVHASDIGDALRQCIAEPEALAELSTSGQLLVDGLGAARLAEFLDPTPPRLLRLSPADRDDMLLYFGWANDREVRRQSIHTREIVLEEHKNWFAAKIFSARSHLFVLWAGNLPVGQIRFDQEGDEVRIDYSIESVYRGRGWARRLVALGMEQLGNVGKFVFRADVKESNLPSRAVFARLGFVESEPLADGLRSYLFDPSVHAMPDVR